jgi:superfamily I DNA and/or RNA helicase
VKTAEAVQGDERDVLILPAGYGPDENGQVKMDFGPLIRQGGHRRFNVAITRARHRREIVTSICPQRHPGSVTSEGLNHLRRYLTMRPGPRPCAAR